MQKSISLYGMVAKTMHASPVHETSDGIEVEADTPENISTQQFPGCYFTSATNSTTRRIAE